MCRKRKTAWRVAIVGAVASAAISAHVVSAAEDLPGRYRLYRANLHVHTKLSTRPSEVPVWRYFDSWEELKEQMLRRDHFPADNPVTTCELGKQIGLDCVGLSDHGLALTDTEWIELGTCARETTRGDFVTLRGFEWTGPGGHINIFGSESFTSAHPQEVGGTPSGDRRTSNLDELCSWVRERSSRGDRIVCQVNHPSDEKCGFDDFTMAMRVPDLVDHFALFEIGSGPMGHYAAPADTEDLFRRALRRGWRVAPTIGIDNFGSLAHGARIRGLPHGARKRHTAVLVAPAQRGQLSEGTILEALRSRRVYASEDDDFALEFWAKGARGKAFMGSVLPARNGDRIALHVWARSQLPQLVIGSSDAIGDVRLVTVRSRASDDSEDAFAGDDETIREFSYSGAHEVTVRRQDVCYYIKINQPDGDWVVSAPIWIGRKRAPVARAVPTTTVLAVDSSGSMGWNTPDGKQKLEAAKEAARNYLEIIDFDATDLGADHEVALLSFSDSAYPVCSPTSDMQDVRDSLNQLSPLQNTNFGDALDNAISWLANLAPDRANGRKFIIFLSDGMTNTGPVHRAEFLVDDPDEFDNPLRLYQRARDAGIRIYTVGFGDPSKVGGWLFFGGEEGLDEEVLQRIAQVTGGEYVRAEDADQLAGIYMRASHTATGDVIFESTGMITQGEQRREGPFNPAASRNIAATKPSQGRAYVRIPVPRLGSPALAEEQAESQMLITLGWSEGELGIELKDPSGQVVDDSYPGLRARRDAQPICIAIDSPKVGNWEATISGDNVPGGGTRYHLIVSARVPPGGGGAVAGGLQVDAQTLAFILTLAAIAVAATACVVVAVRRRRPTRVAVVAIGSLEVRSPGKDMRSVPVGLGVLRIGRGSGNDVVVADAKVSARHAEIRVEGGQVMIADLDSTNGTWVNGERVTTRALRNRDRIQLGDTVLTFIGRQ